MSGLISKQQQQAWSEDGFVFCSNLIDSASIPALHQAFEDLFHGRFETGVPPDEVNWQFDRSDPGLTRQICNGWKANRTIARTILDKNIAEAIAALTGWSGVRVMIDNVLWKPQGAKSLGFHQDSAFLKWFSPNDLATCWIALDDTSAQGGTMELVKGSHRWQIQEPEGEFHAPENYRKPMLDAARLQGEVPQVVPVEVPAGGGSFHHGHTWHGSGENTGEMPRRALVLHAMQADVRYVPQHLGQGIGPIYSRYKKFNSVELDEHYFPIVWREDGYRTPGLDAFVSNN